MLSRFVKYGGLILTAMTASCRHSASVPLIDSTRAVVAPAQWQALLKLASGHQFALVQFGVLVLSKAPDRRMFGVAYVSNDTAESLERSVDEMCEYIRPLAESVHERSVAVIAYPRAGESDKAFGLITVFNRNAFDEWSRTEGGKAPPLPATPALLVLDDRAEDCASEGAAEWLALLDAGAYDEAWSVTAGEFRSQVARGPWIRWTKTERAAMRCASIRSLLSTMFLESQQADHEIQSVALRYSYTCDGLTTTSETVTMKREKDGMWRVSGYSIVQLGRSSTSRLR